MVVRRRDALFEICSFVTGLYWSSLIHSDAYYCLTPPLVFFNMAMVFFFPGRILLAEALLYQKEKTSKSADEIEGHTPCHP